MYFATPVYCFFVSLIKSITCSQAMKYGTQHVLSHSVQLILEAL